MEDQKPSTVDIDLDALISDVDDKEVPRVVESLENDLRQGGLVGTSDAFGDDIKVEDGERSLLNSNEGSNLTSQGQNGGSSIPGGEMYNPTTDSATPGDNLKATDIKSESMELGETIMNHYGQDDGAGQISGRPIKTEGIPTSSSSVSTSEGSTVPSIPSIPSIPSSSSNGDPMDQPATQSKPVPSSLDTSQIPQASSSSADTTESIISPTAAFKNLPNAVTLNNFAQESAKQALNNLVQEKGLNMEQIWGHVVKLKQFLTSLMQLASGRGNSVKRAVESNVHKLMANQLTEEEFVGNLEKDLNSPHQPNLLPFLKNSVPYLRVFLFHQQQFIKRYMQALAKKKQQQSAAPSSAQQANVPTSSTAVSSSGGGIEMVNLTASINNLTNAKLSDLQRQQILMNLTPEQRKTVQLALLKQQQKKAAGGNAAITSKAELSQLPTQVGTSLPPHYIQQVKNTVAASKQRSQLTEMSASEDGSMPTLNKANLTKSPAAVALATKGKNAKIGGKKRVDKKGKGLVGSAINLDEDDEDEEEELAGVNLQEETAHFLPAVVADVPTGSCEDVPFLPVDAVKMRIGKTAAPRGITEVSDSVATLVSHSVEERMRCVLEKLAVICSHRMESLKEDEDYELQGNVKMQLKKLEDIDRSSIERKHEVEMQKLLRAAKSRNKDDPEVARMKEQAKMKQQEQEEEIRKRAANQTALAAIGTRKRPPPSDISSQSLSGRQLGEMGGGTFTTQGVPPRLKQKRMNIRDVIFYLEHERETRKSLTLYKALMK